MARRRSARTINAVVAHLPGVVGAVHDSAEHVAGRAEKRLDAHRQTGQAHIEVTQGITDSYVSLVDEAALSIEFGHYHWKNPERFVPGLYIVTGAAHDL